MECRDKPGVPPRKLIQARLPFKRLNPIPKDKPEASSGIKKARHSQYTLDQNLLSPGLPAPLLDNTENDCQEVETPLVPPLVNGKGPLDSFVQKGREKNTGPPSLVIDLTTDSSHGRSDLGDHGTFNKAGVPLEKVPRALGTQADQQKPDFNDVPENDRSVASDKAELSSMALAQPEASEAKEGKLKNVIFERKMPVVVLEDILMARAPHATTVESSLPSGNKTMEIPAGEEKLPTNSSLSSVSPDSSPESAPAKERKDLSPVASSTPVGKASQKIQRRSEEREKLRLQKEQERAEKERLKEEAKAAKERAREEAKRKKDEERREKREKDEKEKAEKLRAKEEKRKERQEALEAKQEEKRKKEEEKRLKEEEKRIKAEKAEITRFFQKPKTQPAPKTLAGWCGKFAPFEIKENMVLAPQCRVTVDQDLLDQLDGLLQSQDHGTSFLEELSGREPCRSGPTLACSSSVDAANSDIVIVGGSQAGDIPDRKKFGRMKLLQFCENHRPAYWGTWNKKSSAIRPRNPWSKDENLLDYEVESDEEWEEEEPGESLSHSEGDEDEEGGEEEDEDDGFFVPHGYLSEDEGVAEDCDPENHKARQRLKAKEWDELITKGKRFRVLQPVKIGCLWEGEKGGDGPSAEARLLQQFAACILDASAVSEDQEEKGNKKKIKDEQILEQLLPLLHGNWNGSRVIIQEFQECCRLGLLPGPGSSPLPAPESGTPSPSAPPGQSPLPTVPSKARLKRIISENSVYEKRPEHRMCWYVHQEVLKTYQQEKLPVPCQWSYVTQLPSSVAKEEGGTSPGGAATQTTPVASKRKSAGSMSITKFMKRPLGVEQAETPEIDGFQADTEEDDDDCVIVDLQQSQAPVLKTSETASAMEQADIANCPNDI